MAIRIFVSGEISRDGTVRVARWVAKQQGTVGVSSVASAAIAADARYITVQTDQACHIAFGDSPVATTNDFKMAAGDTQDWAVRGGEKIAWIQA